jgi:hypothetical protein
MRAVVAAALLVIAWPASAQAARYGGGTPADSPESAQRQLTMVGLRTTTADGTGRVWAKVAARCGVAALVQDVQVAADGAFGFRGTVETRLPGGVHRRARVVGSGQIVGKVVSGTVRARLTLTRHGRVVARCHTGDRAWQARDPFSLGPYSPARPNTAYYGITTQTKRAFPVVLKVDATGRRVTTVAFEYRHRCKNRDDHELDNITPGGPIAADGSFHLLERFTLHYAEGNERYRVTVDGQFATDGMSGILKVKSVLRSRRTGRVLDRCTTGAHTDFGANF